MFHLTNPCDSSPTPLTRAPQDGQDPSTIYYTRKKIFPPPYTILNGIALREQKIITWGATAIALF